MLEAEKTTPFSHLQTWDDIKAARSQGEFPDPTGDIRKAECVFRVWEIEGPDLARFPLDLSHFEKTIPRFDKRNSTLSGRIAKAGISPSTYKQCRASARRVIVHATSEVDNAIINNGPDDEWEKLQASLKALAGVGLVTRPQIASLSNLILHAQTSGIIPQDLCDATTVSRLLDTAPTRRKRTKIRNGLNTLSKLVGTPGLSEILPKERIALPAARKKEIVVAPHLEAEIFRWATVATTSMSEQSFALYRAALRGYVSTLDRLGHNTQSTPSLLTLFENPEWVGAVFSDWSSGDNLSQRTYVSYTLSLAAGLKRVHQSDAREDISYLADRIVEQAKANKMFFIQGTSKTMGKKGQSWCRDVVNDRRLSDLFETQHIKYYHMALQEFDNAKRAGFDLRILANPDGMAQLTKVKRSRASRILKRVQKCGVLAAYSAIALEGAPFRRANLLQLRHTGPRKTFFDHLRGDDAHAIIAIPNEELKNGIALTKANERLEPIEIRKRDRGDLAVDILRFYLGYVRPLFAGAAASHCLFPPLSPKASPNTGLNKGTFDTWLADLSAEIGLPMTSHHFRHGYATLSLEYGKATTRELAKVLGNSPEVLESCYAFLDAKKAHKRVQEDVSVRRREAIGRSPETLQRRRKQSQPKLRAV